MSGDDFPWVTRTSRSPSLTWPEFKLIYELNILNPEIRLSQLIELVCGRPVSRQIYHRRRAEYHNHLERVAQGYDHVRT